MIGINSERIRKGGFQIVISHGRVSATEPGEKRI